MKEFTQDDQQKWQSISTLTQDVLSECNTYGQLIVVDFKTGKVLQDLSISKSIARKRKSINRNKAA